MNDVTEFIKTPEHHSDVLGYDLTAIADIEPSVTPNEQVAHQEYINVQVIPDGTNPTYRDTLSPHIVVFFVHPSIKMMVGRYENALYVSMYTDVPVNRLVLTEKFDTPGLIGLCLEFWSEKSQDEPIFELCVAPLPVTTH
tara:strand:- start:1095 stop:1514 length:420 start_codon:yes stop_codon:yes gene_type:complete